MLGRRLPSRRIGPFDVAENLNDQVATTLSALTDGDAVYLNSNGIGPAQANASSTMHAIGVAIGSANSGDPASWRPNGVYTSSQYNFSGDIGKNLYVSTGTAGGLVTEPPGSSGQIVQLMGFVLSQTSIMIQPGTPVQVGAGLY